MVDGFLNLYVQLGSADRLSDDVAGPAIVRVGTTARPGFLRIAASVFEEPRSGLQQCEMRLRRGRHDQSQDSRRHSQSREGLHQDAPCVNVLTRSYGKIVARHD